MPDYDGGFKIAARVSGQQLSQVAGVPCQGWQPLGDTLQTTERLADRAFLARQGQERFVVYLEAYTRWDQSAPWSVLAKSGLLSERERLPTWSLIFVLLRQGYHSQRGRLRLRALGKTTQQVWFKEVPLWRKVPQPWWDQAPGLMALYPLCRHGQSQQAAITHATQNITAAVDDRYVRADLLTTLAIFGKLVYPSLNVLELLTTAWVKTNSDPRDA